MIHSKPGQLAQFKAGLHISAIDHFSATLNWIVSCLDNMKKDDGEPVEGLTEGRPKISASMKLKSGEDSNIVVSKKPDKDGYYTLDIYYV